MARPEDQAFLEEMAAQAGAHRTYDYIQHPHYQDGVRATLTSRGGYWRRVIALHDAAVASGRQDRALINAFAASSFDLVALDGEQRIGALCVSSSRVLIERLMDLGIASQQVLGLMSGLPKLVSLAVSPHVRGQGVGGALLDLYGALLHRMAVVGTYADCDDTPALVNFYVRHGFRTLPEPSILNLWPVAGGYLAGDPTPPEHGPRINADTGQRIVVRTLGTGGKAEDAFLALNWPGGS